MGCEITDEACLRAAKLADPGVVKFFYGIGECELTSDLCAEAAEHHRLETLKWLHEQVHCPWDAFEVAFASLEICVKDPTERARVLEYLYEQGESFTDEQLTELLKRSVVDVESEAELFAAKWLRARGAPWPEVLWCGMAEESPDEQVDWPEAAVIWCRAEGCTAPLWSEVNNAYDSGDDVTDENEDTEQEDAEEE